MRKMESEFYRPKWQFYDKNESAYKRIWVFLWFSILFDLEKLELFKSFFFFLNSHYGSLVSLVTWDLEIQMKTVFLLLFFMVPGLELRASTLSHSTSPFCVRNFWDRVLWTIWMGCLQTAILLICGSWVAAIMGVSHQCLVLMKTIF
jgi:hypothetical protein